MAIRPNIRYVQAEQYLDDLANGEICLALGWSGDVLNAAARAREANRGVVIRYNIARQGALLFFDNMAIPADAPHPRNAHLFINYMLRPEVAARNSSFVHYASANVAAYSADRPPGARQLKHLPAARGHGAPGARPAALARLHARADAGLDPLQDRPLSATRTALPGQSCLSRPRVGILTRMRGV